MKRIYLDDVRTPTELGWEVVRNYSEFVKRVEEIGLEESQKLQEALFGGIRVQINHIIK
jgi:hypothetical protein